jgi:putative molybdopterin biosynthesis protein
VLTLHASHDLARSLLRDLASQSHGLHIDLRFAGTVDALAALAQGRCLVAGFHVPAKPAGTPLVAAAIRPLIKPSQHVLIGCVRRTHGLMVQPGNPLGLRGLADLLPRPGHAPRFLNRQPGSGTRLLLDQLLAAQGLQPDAIVGWSGPPEDSHMAVAAALAGGGADAGPGIEATARAFGLDFVRLVDEDYHLVCQKQSLGHPAVHKLRAALRDPTWPQALRGLAGYAPARGGEVRPLTKALPWWTARQPGAVTA